MPFDGTNYKATTYNRQLLIDALRSQPFREQIHFQWKFITVYRKLPKCGAVGCAIGLAHEMGLIPKPQCYLLADAIGIPRRLGRKLFMPFRAKSRYGVQISKVTPEMVADKLETIGA